MLEELFNTTTLTETSISIGTMLLMFVVAILMGGLISIIYLKTSKTRGTSQSFALTLIILPPIIAIMICNRR